MFVLQRVQNAQVTYSTHEHRCDVYADVRSNYGLTDAEFWEFLYVESFERPTLYLGMWEGDLPEPESAMFAKAKKAVHVQAERLGKLKK